MNDLPEKVATYLLKYAYPNWKLEYNNTSKINTVIVIPAISEYYNLFPLLNSLLKNDNKYFSSTLILFVINNTSQSSVEIKENNQRSIKQIRNIIRKKMILNLPKMLFQQV